MVARGHKPVLVREVVQALKIKRDGIYFDATFGRGGHSREILALLGTRGRLIAIDADPEAIRSARSDFKDDPRVTIMQDRFAELKRIAEELSLVGRVDGVLFDLGVSSPQFEDPRRGFSFSREGPLDMRMDPGRGVTARKWLQEVREQDLERVLRELGEERYARRIARAIVNTRKEYPIESTADLVRVVERALPRADPHKHPATRTFQAIRMFINQELEQLREALPQAVELLCAGGRLVVISFHSLEDRLVKRFFRLESKGDPYPPDFPVPHHRLFPRLRVMDKPKRPGEEEIRSNPRARSAVLRVAERTEAAYA